MRYEDVKPAIEELRQASQLCDESLRVLMCNDSLGHAIVYGKLVGAYMGRAYANILEPLWRKFPDLRPVALDAAEVDVEPTLSVATQDALRAFLERAHRAAQAMEASISEEDREQTFNYGGLSELDGAVKAIERFLARPRTP